LATNHIQRRQPNRTELNTPLIRTGLRAFLFGLLLSVLSIGVAVARDFPPLSKVGTLRGFERPFVRIGSKTFQLAPAARIFDQNNRLILPATLPAGARVVYKLEAQTGFLHELWLLLPGETVTILQ
jgi:hypothetical protein